MMSLKKRSCSLTASLGSCLVCLAILSIVATRLFADHDSIEPKDQEDSPKTPLKVVSADDGNPRLTLTIDGDDQKTYEVAPGAPVRLNGSPASVEDIVAGDVLVVEKDTKGHLCRIDATRMQMGIVFASGSGKITLTTDYTDKLDFEPAEDATVLLNGEPARLEDLQRGDQARVSPNPSGKAQKIDVRRISLALQFWDNFRHNLFKPLLLFFYMGFSVPLLKIAFEFPHVIYQGLTIYLLVAIGWHGGEELAELSGSVLTQALLFMGLGFVTNFFLGIIAYLALRGFIPKLRRIDAATVAAYYGSDSAGTFVTCVGVLSAASISYAAYMPVMLAIMEIPGCLVGLFLVSRLRNAGMDPMGNMPGEPGYNPAAIAPVVASHGDPHDHAPKSSPENPVEAAKQGSLERKVSTKKSAGIFNAELLREVFLNPGLFLLFGGIVIGFVSRLQGHKVTDADDILFVTLFQGMLCLFLLEMGMTASKRLKDLKTAGWKFILFGITAPNVFATTGICIAHAFSLITGSPLQLGTYVLFAVLCGAASYIAVPAIQRLAIPEASPTLPLAASLGLTFSYNVTVGIPVYIMVAQIVIMAFPVGGP
jgi:hypothetical protein